MTWEHTGEATERNVPAYEKWFYKSLERVAEFKQSVAQAEAGKMVSIDLGPREDE